MLAALGLTLGIAMMLPRAKPHPSCGLGFSHVEHFSRDHGGPEYARWRGITGALNIMGEPSLACTTDTPVYRFLWMRTFHHPVAVRVERDGAVWRVFAVELDGAGGYDPGSVLRRVERTLTPYEAKQFEAMLVRVDVWGRRMPQRLQGVDGATWLIEARDGARSRIHDAWTPSHGREREIGLMFLSFTGWAIPPEDIY
ncbi:MAG: hypothetical protein KF800_02020 [Lysobacter sp.]|nr:hypothetical protein [Lysobacter sp.]